MSGGELVFNFNIPKLFSAFLRGGNNKKSKILSHGLLQTDCFQNCIVVRSGGYLNMNLRHLNIYIIHAGANER